MDILAWVIAGVALAMLAGQFFAGTADYFLSIENPRPLDDNEVVITVLAWGFASQGSRTCTADLAGQGFADVRLFTTRKQILLSIITLGCVRRVSVAWRGNAGQHPLGDA